VIKFKKEFKTNPETVSWAPVAQACNPNYLGDWD
jgi:hypothetical protein